MASTSMPKKKRGQTKMKTIALNGDNRIEVKFNDKGQPIDEESVKLSSFLGPLGREIVPYTISDWRKVHSDMREILWKCVQLEEEWQKHYVFKEMGALWRASKSRLVNKIKMAKNEEERMALKPDNISSISEWKKFVAEKTGSKFKDKSDEMKKRRKRQTPYTGGRRGYARMTEDIKNKSGKQAVSRVEVWIKAHKKKNGEPVNTKAAETIEKLQEMDNDSCLPTSSNVRKDAITKVLGPDKGGHVRGLGKGVTLTQLSILSQRDSLIAQMTKEQAEMKKEMGHMKDLLNLVLEQKQGQRQTVEESTNVSVARTISHKTKCKLLDWTGSNEVVAEGRFSSNDPAALVHHVPIGPNAMRVWIDIAKEPSAFLWRPASEMVSVEDAVGSTVAWPTDKVVMTFSN